MKFRELKDEESEGKDIEKVGGGGGKREEWALEKL